MRLVTNDIISLYRTDIDSLVEAQEATTEDLIMGLEYFLQELDVTLQTPDLPHSRMDDPS